MGNRACKLKSGRSWYLYLDGGHVLHIVSEYTYSSGHFLDFPTMSMNDAPPRLTCLGGSVGLIAN